MHKVAFSQKEKETKTRIHRRRRQQINCNRYRLYPKSRPGQSKTKSGKEKRALTISQIPPQLISCGGYFTYWLEQLRRPQLAPKTYVGYKTALAKHLNPHLGNMPLQRLERRHIQELSSASETSKKRETRPLMLLAPP